MTQNHFIEANAAQAPQVLGAPEGTDRLHNAPISLSASEDETLEAARSAVQLAGGTVK